MFVTKFTLLIYFAVCTLLVILTSNVQKKQKSIIFILLTFVGIVLITFRGNLGSDTANYLSFIRHIESWNIKKYLLHFEPLFIYFVLLTKSLINSHLFVFFTTATLSLFLISDSVKKISPNPLLSLVIFLSSYFLSLEFNQIRQGISIGFFIYSLEFLFQKAYLKYYLIILIGCFFHSSLFLCLLVPLIPRKTETRVVLFFVFVSFIFVFIPLPLSSVVKLVAPFVPSMVSDKLLYYILSKYAVKVGFSLVQSWYILIIFIGCYYARLLNDTKFEFLFNLFVAGVCLNFLFNSVSVMLRLSYPLLFVEIFIPPLILRYSKNKVILTICFICFYALRYINLLNGFK